MKKKKKKKKRKKKKKKKKKTRDRRHFQRVFGAFRRIASVLARSGALVFGAEIAATKQVALKFGRITHHLPCTAAATAAVATQHSKRAALGGGGRRNP